jgi:endonuclease-3
VISIKARALEVHRRLLTVYGRPEWRKPLPALDELVSTILSQNTNDVNRDRAFDALRNTFPTWEAVRDADPDLVVEAIRPAGLANQKGPRIQRVLQQITQERGELDLEFLRGWPADKVFDWLIRFKGVGPKTASIVMLFSLDKPAFPVDTHVYRVTGRLGLRAAKTSAERAHQTLAEIFPEDSYYAVHLNLIRHGREVCHARTPQCPSCVLQDLCEFFDQHVKA